MINNALICVKFTWQKKEENKYSLKSKEQLNYPATLIATSSLCYFFVNGPVVFYISDFSVYFRCVCMSPCYMYIPVSCYECSI